MNARSERILFLAWQDREKRQWFPIGRLDAAAGRRRYRFRYIGGVKRAEEDAGFAPLREFPDRRETTSRPISSRCSGTG